MSIILIQPIRDKCLPGVVEQGSQVDAGYTNENVVFCWIKEWIRNTFANFIKGDVFRSYLIIHVYHDFEPKIKFLKNFLMMHICTLNLVFPLTRSVFHLDKWQQSQAPHNTHLSTNHKRVLSSIDQSEEST